MQMDFIGSRSHRVVRMGVFKAHCWLLFVMVSFAGEAFPAVDPLAVEVGAISVSADYVLRTWAVDEGLPSNRVTGLTQTPDGYLWVGTPGGLTRFDGVGLTTFLSEVGPGLESDPVTAVFTARDGTLWMGMDGGAVGRRVDGRFQMITPGAERAGAAISFTQDASGAV